MTLSISLGLSLTFSSSCSLCDFLFPSSHACALSLSSKFDNSIIPTLSLSFPQTLYTISLTPPRLLFLSMSFAIFSSDLMHSLSSSLLQFLSSAFPHSSRSLLSPFLFPIRLSRILWSPPFSHILFSQPCCRLLFFNLTLPLILPSFLFHALVSIFLSPFHASLLSFYFPSVRLIPLLPPSVPYSLFSPSL